MSELVHIFLAAACFCVAIFFFILAFAVPAWGELSMLAFMGFFILAMR